MKKIILLLFILIFLFSGCVTLKKDFDQLDKDIEAATESGTKWSSYGPLTSGNIGDSDDFLVRDISDQTLGSTGTQKRYSFSALKTDLQSISEFGFPYDANITLDEDCEAGVDTTDNQLLYYSGALRVLTYKYRQCFTLESPSDSDDNIPIFSLDDGFTVTRLDCRVMGGTSAVVVLNDGTNNLDSMTCLTTETSDTSLSNNTFTALEGMECDIGTVTGSVDWVRMCFTYTITRE